MKEVNNNFFSQKHIYLLFIHYFIGFHYLYPTIFQHILINIHHVFVYNLSIYLYYILILIFTILLGFSYFKQGWDNFISNKGKVYQSIVKNFLFIIICTVVVGGILSIFTSSSSANQEMLEDAVQFQPVFISFKILIFAPFVEECIFRGALKDFLLKKFSIQLTIFVSSFIFGLFHVLPYVLSGNTSDFLFFIQYFVLGYFFAKSNEESSSMFSGIGLHILNNLFAFIQMLG